MSVIRTAIWAGLGAAALVGFGLGRCGSPDPVYRNVEVPVEVVREVERVDTVISWKERVVFRTLPPVTIATAPGGAQSDVEAFCGPIAVDTIREPVLLLRSVRTAPGWFFAPDRVFLTGPLSNGDLRQLTYSARPGWQAHVLADTAVFQSPRFWWARELVEAGAYIGAGYLLGQVLP